jgi:hypothetical protein
LVGELWMFADDMVSPFPITLRHQLCQVVQRSPAVEPLG